MKIYIQTGSAVPEKGYAWQEISSDSILTPKEPESYKTAAEREWLNDGDFSLLLSQGMQGHLALVITLPRSPTLWRRRDHQNRTLRCDLAWEAEDKEDNEFLKKLAVVFLATDKSELEDWIKKVDVCIEKQHDAPAGFSVRREDLEKATQEWESRSVSLPSYSDNSKESLIAMDSPSRRVELAALISHLTLPSEKSHPPFLVLLTWQDPYKFEAYSGRLWRVLSSAAENESWESLKKGSSTAVSTYVGGGGSSESFLKSSVTWFMSLRRQADSDYKNRCNSPDSEDDPEKKRGGKTLLALVSLIGVVGLWLLFS